MCRKLVGNQFPCAALISIRWPRASGGGGLGEVAIRHIQNVMWAGNTRVAYKCNRYNIAAQDICRTHLYTRTVINIRLPFHIRRRKVHLMIQEIFILLIVLFNLIMCNIL